MKHNVRKYKTQGFANASNGIASAAFNVCRPIIHCFIICCLMLIGCATTTKTNISQTVANVILPTPNMSDATSCQQVGYSCFEIAWSMLQENKLENREQMLKLYVRGVELLEHSMVLLKAQSTDTMYSEDLVCRKLAWVCRTAKTFFPNEPQRCREYHERAILYLRVFLEKYQARLEKERVADQEYELAFLYYLIGDEDNAFNTADRAWGDGYRHRWNQEFWTWLKNCVVKNKMKTTNLPPVYSECILLDI